MNVVTDNERHLDEQCAQQRSHEGSPAAEKAYPSNDRRGDA
jgi:hypothetical protein